MLIVAYGFRYCAPFRRNLLTYATLLHSSSPISHLSSRFHYSRGSFSRMEHHSPSFSSQLGSAKTAFLLYLVILIYAAGNTAEEIACDPVKLGVAKATCDPNRYFSGNGIKKNSAMVGNLQRYGVISSQKVVEVMQTIDRALFVPNGASAYDDSPMGIGYNVTISAPHMHATCLQLLEEHLKPGMHALDVGSGTGYLTACFAVMVGPQGRAVGVEHIPELVSSSIENIQKSEAASYLKEGSLSVHVADGRLGWPEHAPYDAIHVGAAAPEIPGPLIEQLKPGGRLVIPVGNLFQELQVVDKNMDGSITVRSETSVRYVPLTSREAQLRGN